jgi:hypothetical protein
MVFNAALTPARIEERLGTPDEPRGVVLIQQVRENGLENILGILTAAGHAVGCAIDQLSVLSVDLPECLHKGFATWTRRPIGNRGYGHMLQHQVLGGPDTLVTKLLTIIFGYVGGSQRLRCSIHLSSLGISYK